MSEEKVGAAPLASGLLRYLRTYTHGLQRELIATQAIGLAIMLVFCPESPRQLVAHGRLEQADACLLRIYRTSTLEQRQAKIRSIEMSIQEAISSLVQESLWVSFKRIFNTASNARAVVTACVVMAISQLGGFNTLMYYSSTLFAIVGFNDATAVGITVSGTNL